MFRKGPDQVRRFLGDESNIFAAPEASVEGVHFPETKEEVIEILEGANASRTFVTTSGAGTGIVGGRVPIHGGMVISLERMDKPACEMTGDDAATCNPGVAVSELDLALPGDLVYPPDPTERTASLGGTVATNASGARCFYYGPTRRWVTALRVVLGNGEPVAVRRGESVADREGILRFSSESGSEYAVRIPEYRMPDVKNAAGLFSKPGMDLIDLFIGSEGILGMFTEVEVALEKKSPIVSDIAFFKDESDSFAYAEELRQFKSEGVLAVEFFDRHSLDFIAAEGGGVPEGMGAAVFVEALGSEFGLVERLSALQEAHGAYEDWFARTSADQRDLKEFRHSLPDAVNTYLKEHDSYKLGTDFVVPRDRFEEMVEAYRMAGERFSHAFPRSRAHHVLFGHVGDCHLHFNFITHGEDERRLAKELYADLARKAVALGGTISGEHGVGKKSIVVDGVEMPYLQLMYGEAGLMEIARVKKALDPNGILNVGNMVPREYLL